ncbi:MAG: hypothetical protein KGL16_03420 [Acidobacteriota bacterium]|nr:hypothetical protein [Acidobacteriota bacterium]
MSRRARPTAVLVVAAVCACAGGPALAAVAAQSSTPSGARATGAAATAATGPATTGPETRTFTSTQTASTTTTTTTTTSTTPATPPVPNLHVCLKAARADIARRLRVRSALVRRRQRAGSNGMPQCNYLVEHARGVRPHARVVVVVNVDNGPQPLWRLMRKVVEAGQIFGPTPPGWRPPLGVEGLGPYASWFFNLDQLMADTANYRYLLTVSIVWPRARHAEMIGLARVAIAPYRRVARFAA